ncbi:MAG: serine hydrolase [Chryseotalea sp.]
MCKKVFGILLFPLLFSFQAWSQSNELAVDSLWQKMTWEERIAQLFILPVDIENNESAERSLQLIKNWQPGFVVFNVDGPVKSQHFNQKIDEIKNNLVWSGYLKKEHWLQKDSVWLLPPPVVLAACGDTSLLKQSGQLQATWLTQIGFDFVMPLSVQSRVLANNDTLYNHWGDDSFNFSSKAKAFIQGLNSKNFEVVVSYNPNQTKKPWELDANFLMAIETEKARKTFQYKELLKKLQVPDAVLSPILFQSFLRKKNNFSGLLVADISEITFAGKKTRAGEAELFAFQSGNDLFYQPKNMQAGIRKIKSLVRKDKSYQKQLEASVKKVLTKKFERKRVERDANSSYHQIKHVFNALHHNLAEASISIVKNEKETLPIRHLELQSIASVSIGQVMPTTFQSAAELIAPIQHFQLIDVRDTTTLFNSLKKFSVCLLAIYPTANWHADLLANINRLAQHTQVVLINYDNPAELQHLFNVQAILQAYYADKAMEQAAANLIFGSAAAKGDFPFTVNSYTNTTVKKFNAIDRLKVGVPEQEGLSSFKLDSIAPIVAEAINIKATPGCVVLVARNGRIIYNKAFGWQTYENQIATNTNTIYDLASISKVAATLQTTAFLHYKKEIDVYKKMSVYLPELKSSNKKDFTIKDILIHQAGLWPFLPFWAQTKKDSLFLPEFYAKDSSANFPFPVSKNLYATVGMKDSLWQWIIKAKIREKPLRTPYDYRYSDMGFYMLHHLAEKKLNQPMEDFLQQNWYEPLGAHTLGYLPLRRFLAYNIAPTEYDFLFRRSLLQGYVHDQGAAMHGGIAGHAGLFGSAADLAKVGQLWLQYGNYGGQTFLDSATVTYFTQKQYEGSRRGIGWDKPDFINPNLNPASRFASPETFGHTGFTGTCIWADPQHHLLFIFLSNRVHPDMNNAKLLTYNIRPRVHDIVYKALFDYRSIF